MREGRLEHLNITFHVRKPRQWAKRCKSALQISRGVLSLHATHLTWHNVIQPVAHLKYWLVQHWNNIWFFTFLAPESIKQSNKLVICFHKCKYLFFFKNSNNKRNIKQLCFRNVVDIHFKVITFQFDAWCTIVLQALLPPIPHSPISSCCLWSIFLSSLKKKSYYNIIIIFILCSFVSILCSVIVD